MNRFLVATLLSLSMATLAASQVTLKVNPSVCLAPCTLSVKIRVGSHPDDSSVILTVDGDEYFAQDQFDLGPETTLIPEKIFPRLPSGNYLITAALVQGTDQDHQKFLDGDTAKVEVKGDDSGPIFEDPN